MYQESDPLYERVTRSPYLSAHMHTLLERLLSPDELISELQLLIKAVSADAQTALEEITLGVTASGRQLIGWRLKRADRSARPIILSANQHHGPENNGASVALYFSYLLTLDPRWRGLLDEYDFVFFPQQNPDALDRRGNLNWMRSRASVEAFARDHQYDPRSVDVEHGVPASLLTMNARKRATIEGDAELLYQGFKRPETRALIQWIDETLSAGQDLHAYLSGHAWDLLNGPLFLISGATPSHERQRAWIERVLTWSERSPLALNNAPPLSSDYVLRAPLSLSDAEMSLDSSLAVSQTRGVYQAPRREDFQSLNQQSGVMYSTLAYVEARVPEAVVVVLEPPILQVSCEGRSGRLLIDQRRALLRACASHDELIRLITHRDAWTPARWPRPTLEARLLRGGGGSDDALEARVILEVFEQEMTRAVWEELFRRVDSGALALTLSTDQLIVATAGQRFATANLAAQVLKLAERAPSSPTLAGLDLSLFDAAYHEALSDLSEFDLDHVDARAASFVYIAALLSAAGAKAEELTVGSTS